MSTESLSIDLFNRQRHFAAEKFLQAMTIQNKRNLEEGDPRLRETRERDLAEAATDPEKARDHLIQTSMIAGFRAANAIR